MACFIHPYRGYINTRFSLFHDNKTNKTFTIRKIEKNLWEKEIEVHPNSPEGIVFCESGIYGLFYDNKMIQKIFVEDGYKFGGRTFKNAFLFEDTPWIFVVMYDRTYFHNRETRREYVEIVSPDNIEYVSASYVLFSNAGSTLQTLYSLDNECPVIVFENLLFKNEDVIIWQEIEGEKKRLCIVNLTNTNFVQKFDSEDHLVSDVYQKLYCYSNHTIQAIPFADISTVKSIDYKGKFLAFISEKYFVAKTTKDALSIVDLGDLTVKTVSLSGTLATINGKNLIDINAHIENLKHFSQENDIETTIHMDFVSMELFLSTNMFTYIEKQENVCIQKGRTKKTVRSVLCNEYGKHLVDIAPDYNICDVVYKYNNLIYIVSRKVLYVLDSLRGNFFKYSGIDNVYQTNFGIYTIETSGGRSILSMISTNGYKEKLCGISPLEAGGFSFFLFPDYGLLKLNSTGKFLYLKGRAAHEVGYCKKETCGAVRSDKGIILKGGDIIHSAFSFYSKKGTYGLEICDNKVLLFSKKKNQIGDHKDDYTKLELFNGIFDTSSYQNVLFSEDGTKILSMGKESSELLDIKTGTSEFFEKQHIISHVNGVRPYFSYNHCRQIRLINPLSGTEIDVDKISQYNFISPKGTYYADTRLEEYVEYYDEIEGREISKMEYSSLFQKYSYDYHSTALFSRNDIVTQKRREFILKHLDFFRAHCNEDGKAKKTSNDIINEFISMNINSFIGVFIKEKGVAVIRQTKDNLISHRINLGAPLWFLNYVAFSQDERYVAIAGRYPNGSGQGGLLLIYNLKEKKVVYKKTDTYAVWTVAFSRKDRLGAYTSDPNTFLGEDPFQESSMKVIHGHNFLAFSTNGDLVAFSKQGYTAWNKGENLNWGHCPSCLVSLRKVTNPEEEICCFEDLSEQGIEGAKAGKTVSSVSFSNDNKHVMMVGKDGVVVIRNLNF